MKGKRPELDTTKQLRAPDGWITLMHKCYAQFPEDRPGMNKVLQDLQEIELLWTPEEASHRRWHTRGGDGVVEKDASDDRPRRDVPAGGSGGGSTQFDTIRSVFGIGARRGGTRTKANPKGTKREALLDAPSNSDDDNGCGGGGMMRLHQTATRRGSGVTGKL